jgi:hypothetical protein
MPLRALGDGELFGERLMQYAFFDETGTGKAATDSHVIVAGLIAHVDGQMPRVERHLSELWNRTIPAEHRPDFVFHASEFFGRRGPVFDKDTSAVSEEDRQLIQGSLAAIPKKFGLPFVLQAVERKQKAGPLVAGDVLHCHVTALVLCSMDVEAWMRANTEGDVYCQLVVEQNEQSEKSIKAMHQAICHPNIQQNSEITPLIAHLLPFQRIRKTVLFEGKNSPSCLEVVDFCAYVIRKTYRNENLAIFQPLMQAFWGQRVFAVV